MTCDKSVRKTTVWIENLAKQPIVIFILSNVCNNYDLGKRYSSDDVRGLGCRRLLLASNHELQQFFLTILVLFTVNVQEVETTFHVIILIIPYH